MNDYEHDMDSDWAAERDEMNLHELEETILGDLRKDMCKKIEWEMKKESKDATIFTAHKVVREGSDAVKFIGTENGKDIEFCILEYSIKYWRTYSDLPFVGVVTSAGLIECYCSVAMITAAIDDADFRKED